ncbi:MAG: HAD family hydrolase [Candidatus Absconditicoccaceae bacterium]
MKKDIKIVALNMYDTWIDMRIKNNPYKKLFYKLGIQENIKELSKILQTTSRDIKDILPQKSLEREDIDLLLKQFNEDIQKQIQSILIYDDFIPTIDFLKKNGYQTAVISNLSKLYAYPVTHGEGKGKFDYEILSFDVGEIKPNIGIFQELQNKSGVDPSKVIMVGDSFVSDVKGSHNAGVYPIYLERSSKGIQDNGRYTKISSLEDLKEIL